MHIIISFNHLMGFRINNKYLLIKNCIRINVSLISLFLILKLDNKFLLFSAGLKQ